jgi:hypothetical protein
MPRQQNGTATPLAVPVRPQTPNRNRQDGSSVRHDGLQGVPGKGSRNDSPPPTRTKCARAACPNTFEKKRPNQDYCSENCRKYAHQERKVEVLVEGLTDVLEELAAAPEQLRQFAGHDVLREAPLTRDARITIETMFHRITALAEKAAAALNTFRSKK